MLVALVLLSVSLCAAIKHSSLSDSVLPLHHHTPTALTISAPHPAGTHSHTIRRQPTARERTLNNAIKEFFPEEGDQPFSAQVEKILRLPLEAKTLLRFTYNDPTPNNTWCLTFCQTHTFIIDIIRDSHANDTILRHRFQQDLEQYHTSMTALLYTFGEHLHTFLAQAVKQLETNSDACALFRSCITSLPWPPLCLHNLITQHQISLTLHLPSSYHNHPQCASALSICAAHSGSLKTQGLDGISTLYTTTTLDEALVKVGPLPLCAVSLLDLQDQVLAVVPSLPTMPLSTPFSDYKTKALILCWYTALITPEKDLPLFAQGMIDFFITKSATYPPFSACVLPLLQKFSQPTSTTYEVISAPLHYLTEIWRDFHQDTKVSSSYISLWSRCLHALNGTIILPLVSEPNALQELLTALEVRPLLLRKTFFYAKQWALKEGFAHVAIHTPHTGDVTTKILCAHYTLRTPSTFTADVLYNTLYRYLFHQKKLAAHHTTALATVNELKTKNTHFTLTAILWLYQIIDELDSAYSLEKSSLTHNYLTQNFSFNNFSGTCPHWSPHLHQRIRALRFLNLAWHQSAMHSPFPLLFTHNSCITASLAHIPQGRFVLFAPKEIAKNSKVSTIYSNMNLFFLHTKVSKNQALCIYTTLATHLEGQIPCEDFPLCALACIFCAYHPLILNKPSSEPLTLLCSDVATISSNPPHTTHMSDAEITTFFRSHLAQARHKHLLKTAQAFKLSLPNTDPASWLPKKLTQLQRLITQALAAL